MHENKLPLALFVLRITIGFFLGMWASLKFFRPEWMQNIFTNRYGLEFVTKDLGIFIGTIQLVIVILFVIGYKRTIFYGLMLLMHLAGVYGSIGGIMNYTKYPNNLLLTTVPTLGALLALFLLRDEDIWTIDGRRDKS